MNNNIIISNNATIKSTGEHIGGNCKPVICITDNMTFNSVTEEERNATIAKVEAKLERRKRIVERIDTEYQNAVHRMMEAEKELAELKGDKSK